MDEYEFKFEWNEAKAAGNFRKHGVSFELASSIFADPQILTLVDTTHSECEERWFSIGLGSNGTMLSSAYLRTDAGNGIVKIRIITARRATAAEIFYYIGSQ